MRSRGWIVQNYMEFLPDDPGLLGINVNRGEEVKIRRTSLIVSVLKLLSTRTQVVGISTSTNGVNNVY
jgi:hypothetical protein